MTFEPLANRVVIKPNFLKEKTIGGLFVPLNLQERNSSGIVVAVGRGTQKNPMEYQIGQVIHHVKGAGVEIIKDNVKYYFIEDIDILGFSNN